MQRIFVPPFNPHAQQILMALVALGLGTIAVVGNMTSGAIDWLLISGGLALLVGVHLSHGVPEALERCLRRLGDRGVIRVPTTLDELSRDMENCVLRRWAPIAGGVVAAGIALAFLGAYGLEGLLRRLPLVLAEVFGGYIAGCYLGRMACYGSLGRYLGKHGCSLRLIPGHPDGVGGWAPIGDFFFFQAVIAGIPAAFVAIWLMLIGFTGFHQRYAHWQEPYGYLLLLAMAFEMAAFVVPLLSFHRGMHEQHGQLQREADRLSSQIAEVQRQLTLAEGGKDLAALKDSLENLSARYWSIEHLPHWPVSRSTRRLFGFGNVGLLIPLLTEYLGLPAVWIELLQNLLTNRAA